MIPHKSMPKIQELPGTMPLDPHFGSALESHSKRWATLEGLPPPPASNPWILPCYDAGNGFESFNAQCQFLYFFIEICLIRHIGMLFYLLFEDHKYMYVCLVISCALLVMLILSTVQMFVSDHYIWYRERFI